MSVLVAEPLSALAPIHLADLVEHGGLMARVDRKYVVPRQALGGLLAGVPRGTRVLEIDGRRTFAYRSTYLDTPDRLSFLTSGRARRGRWKVRGRSYLDTGGSWLETKTTGPRGRTVKHRVVHPEPQDHGLTAEGREFAGRVIGVRHAALLQPVLATGYHRSTLLLPREGGRVTIDVDLGWTSLITGHDLDRNAIAIVETKTGSSPSAVDRQLWDAGHRPVRLSKYGVGMAALEPDLPHLKWHRVMKQHLDLTSTPPRPHWPRSLR